MQGFLFLEHTYDGVDLDDNLYLTKPSNFDDEFEDAGYLEFELDNVSVGQKLWVSVWVDHAYGETINTALTREEIVEKSIQQLRTDYRLNSDVKPKYSMDAYVEHTLKWLKKGDYVTLKHHPLEPKEDLSPPELVIKEVNVVKDSPNPRKILFEYDHKVYTAEKLMSLLSSDDLVIRVTKHDGAVYIELPSGLTKKELRKIVKQFV